MVTRNIVKNTPTQVNSHLIGVRNLPEVTNVKFDIYYKTARTVYGDVYYINNKPYKWRSGYFKTSEGERYCRVLNAVGVGEPGEYQYYYKDTYDGSDPMLMGQSRPEVGTQMYVRKGQYPDYWIEDAGVVCTGTANLTEQDFVVSGPESGGYLPLLGGYQLNMATGEIDFNGEILYVGYVGDTSTRNLIGVFDRVEGNKYFYNVAENTPLPSMSVYTEGRPKVGSEVHTPDNIIITNPSYVSGITEGVKSDCVVSYSVDGKVFTDVDPVLTEDNNVIANIPRYVYLKFSQDVAITEE